jgi:hypothetical protein
LHDQRTKYVAICNKWLATDEDDGQISRFLFPRKETGVERVPRAGKEI